MNRDRISAEIVGVLPMQIALVDARGRIVYVNPAWEALAAEGGIANGGSSVGDDYLAVCRAIAGDGGPEADAAAEGVRAVLRLETKHFVSEFPGHLASGKLWFQLRVTACAGRGAVIMLTDITLRRSMEEALRVGEERLKRLNRMYGVLGGVNTLLVRARDRADLFQEACRIAVEEAGFRMAMIFSAGPDGGLLAPAASFGVDDEYRQAVLRIVASSAASETIGLLALSAGQTLVSNDVLNDARLLLATDYADRGVRSMAALPVVVDGRTLGLFLLYADEKDFFQDAEMKLLSKLASDVAFAIDHIEKIERIAYLAYFDDRTGLANRGLFLERIADRLVAARTAGLKLCLILFDLERFKSINDTFGRDAGDSLLKQVAEWLKAYTDDETRIARVGPDQFAVMTRAFVDKPDLIPYLDRDVAALLSHPFRLNEAVFRIAVRIGLAISPDDGDDAEGLLRHAEVALKQAKKSGARRLFYERRMSDGVAGRLNLENQMRQALDKAEFALHYQPKVSLSTGSLTGVEALIRWNDPRAGLTLPGGFIPVLEESGLIQEVGRWVLRSAIKDHLAWRGSGMGAPRVSVNVSPLQLRGHDFVAEMRRIIGADPRAATGLELEITESLFVDDIGNSIASLQAIREAGVTIAIDDFGTGFSSLSRLAKLPVDTLKIDRSFITGMGSGPKSLSLVSTIIDLGHSLSLSVVAEGVETPEQADALRRLGCDEMQGFLIDKALPADAFEAKYIRAAALAS